MIQPKEIRVHQNLNTNHEAGLIPVATHAILTEAADHIAFLQGKVAAMKDFQSVQDKAEIMRKALSAIVLHGGMPETYDPVVEAIARDALERE